MEYRIDIVGLSTDDKPVEKIENGSTFYCVDNQQLFVFYNGIWYLQGEV